MLTSNHLHLRHINTCTQLPGRTTCGHGMVVSNRVCKCEVEAEAWAGLGDKISQTVVATATAPLVNNGGLNLI